MKHLIILATLLVTAHPTVAQTPEEHASHHPGEATSPNGGDSQEGSGMGGMMGGKGGPPAGAGGGMMGGKGGMGGMMEKMGAPKPKDLYPTLMSLPELTPEKRIEVEAQADERVASGTALMGKGLDALSQGNATENHAAMQEAVATIREGLAQLDSGLAARRALAEGKAPNNVALQWFKREMNLLPPGTTSMESGLFGITPFHLFTMVLLVAFALAMLAMYFFKMRRAAALFGRIEAGKGPPPPGSAPELAGGKPAK
ncbi:hypothetical protein [Haloferula sp.]|uniref:hypothetical protein n=1 Tax=Haloferula sp. TaxID=2497595 RepID=UPI003C77828C